MSFFSEIKTATTESFSAIFQSRKMLVMFLLGFSSGIPLMLMLSTLNLWFNSADISLKDIGLLSLITIPYTFKFMWAPLLDKFTPPFLGRRRGWMLLTQLLLIFAIISVSFFSPEKNPLIIAAIGFFICFISASQDIAINAYQADILTEKERALGSAVYVLGYRLAMFASVSGALIIASLFNWHIAYFSMGILVFIGVIGTFIATKPTYDKRSIPANLQAAVIYPFKEFFTRINFKIALLILFIIIVYKLGDALAFSLNSVFFRRELGFSLIDIGLAYKTSALIATLIGAMAGGIIINRIGLYKGFLWFSLIMAFANLMYVLLAIVGKSYILMVLSVAIEYFAGGLGTAAFLALLLSLCNQSYSATQFAIFSSLDSIGRVFIGPFAGWAASDLGWAWLFTISFAIGIATTIIIYFAKNPICKIAKLETC